MKCDELEEEYLWTNNVKTPSTRMVRAYNADEVDKAIAELKDKVKLCSDFELAARKDIEEMRGQHQMLKQFGHYKLSPVPGEMINHEVRQYVSYNVVCMIINHLESENAELKQKLEDAGTRERRLKRAFLIALAHKAKYKKYWYCELLKQEGSKILSDNKKAKKYNAIIKMCQECEVKCRAKAEEYK